MGFSTLSYAQWHSYNISNAFVRTLVNWQIKTGAFLVLLVYYDTVLKQTIQIIKSIYIYG